MKRSFQFDFLRARGLRPHHRLLDVGCGTLRGGIPLIECLDAGNYFGLEVRAEVLEEARRELRESGLEAKRPQLLHCLDIARFDVQERFDYAWAFSVLIHMTDAIMGDTLRCVARHLAPGGVFYGNVNLGDREPGSWQGFPVVYRSREDIESAAAECGLDVEDLGTLASLGHASGNAAADAQHMLRFGLA